MTGEDRDNPHRKPIHSNVVKAGRRTYFFDVKSTRGKDLFLTITESKKHFHDDGGHSFEKHKLFLYKEDFDKFADCLYDTLAHIEDLRSGNNEFLDPSDAHPQGLTDEISEGSSDPANSFNPLNDHPGDHSTEEGFRE